MSRSEPIVWCNECGTELSETSSSTPAAEREPCPTCGAHSRAFGIVIAASLAATADASRVSRSAEAAIEAGQVDLVCEVRVMRLSSGRMMAEFFDTQSGDRVLGVGDVDSVALDFALEFCVALRLRQADHSRVS